MASGALLAAAGRPGGAVFALVALAPLLAATTRPPGPPLGRAALGGMLAGLLFHGAHLAPLAAVAWSPAPGLAAAAAALLATKVAVWAALVAAITRASSGPVALACAPALWAGLEGLGGSPPFGVASSSLGAFLAGDPRLLALAPLGGSALLGAWAVAVAATGVVWVRARREARRRPRAAALLTTVPLAFGLAASPAGGGGGGSGPAERALRVAAVQPAVPSAHRHDRARFDTNLRGLLALSDRAVAAGPDLLVWPETAWDATAAHGGHRFLGAIAHGFGVPLVTGARRRDAAGALRNSVVYASAGGEAAVVADKRHPVPGYEGGPPGRLGALLARRGLWPGRVVPGAPPRAFEVRDARGRTLRIGALVCFDLHDASLARRLRRDGASLLLVLANESDLGREFAAANARLAQLRAAEHRIPVVRVANTGASTWIDARGRPVAALASERPQAGSAALVPAGAAPLHTRRGPAAALAVALPLFAWALLGPAPVPAAGRLAARRLVPLARCGAHSRRAATRPPTEEPMSQRCPFVRSAIRALRVLSLPALLALVPVRGLATDGASAVAPEEPTYYEQALGGTSVEAWREPAGPLPSQLHVAEGEARVVYRRTGEASAGATWEVRVEGFARRHERVDAVYDLILVLPLPDDGRGGDGFSSPDRGVQLWEGSPDQAVSLVYGDEKLRLKRNVALEKTLLPPLVGTGTGRLPSLAGTGYRYTAWDIIVTRDPQAGDTVQGFARLRYTTDAVVAAPDDADARLAAWWITWIPSLTADVAPYAVRMDVAPAP